MAEAYDALGDRLEEAVRWGTDEQEVALPLWHYTDFCGLSGILQTREFWASHFACMNDPRELTHGEDILVDEVAQLALALKGSSPHVVVLERFVDIYRRHKLPAKAENHTFVASFCTDGDSLYHWHTYGSAGAGYSVGLSHLPEVAGDLQADLGFYALPLEYNEAAFRDVVRRRFQQNFEEYCRFVEPLAETDWEDLARRFAALLLRTAGALSVSYKHSHFQVEGETRFVAVPLKEDAHQRRLILARKRNERVIHYVKLPLTEPPSLLPITGIVVGPLEHGRKERHEAAVALLRRLGYPSPEQLVRSSAGALI